MTSKERAKKILNFDKYGYVTVVDYIASEIDAAVAEALRHDRETFVADYNAAMIDQKVREERKAICEWLESKAQLCTVCEVGVRESITRGDHLAPPKPRYEVQAVQHTAYRILDTATGVLDDIFWHDESAATAERDRLNKEAAK